jgi:hypothetical protein
MSSKSLKAAAGVRGRFASSGRRITASIAATALVIGTMAAAGAIAAPAANAATATTNNLTAGTGATTDAGAVNVVFNISQNTGPGFIHANDPATHYSYLIQKVNIGNPYQTTYTYPTDQADPNYVAQYAGQTFQACKPNSNDTDTVKYDPMYPNHCEWGGMRDSNTADPIVTQGEQGVDVNGVAHNDIPTVTNLPDGSYIISVKADLATVDGKVVNSNAEVGGARFTVPMAKPVNVRVNEGPLPTGTLRIRVFEDAAPVDGTYEIDAERGLQGFRAYLTDQLGDVSNDVFGNPICTVYEHTSSDPTAPDYDPAHPNGAVKLDAEGSPIISAPIVNTANAIAAVGTSGAAASFNIALPAGTTAPFVGAEVIGAGIGTNAYVNAVDTIAARGANPAYTRVTLSERNTTAMASGTTITFSSVNGKCISDENGDVVIPNLFPSRYGTTVRPPDGKKDWLQTTTLEGGPDHDWWVMAGDTGFGAEITYGAELVPEMQFGYIPQKTTSDPVDNTCIGAEADPTCRSSFGNRAPSAEGTASISGNLHSGCKYIGSGGAAQSSAALAEGTASTEMMDCGPFKDEQGLVAVSSMDISDSEVATVKVNADGSYTVPNLKSGNYSITYWDNAMDHILDFANVTITNNQDVNLGTAYIQYWFASVRGYVFQDLNGNGKKDPGEPGVPNLALALRERDNSLMDQMTNGVETDRTGYYNVLQAYPMSRHIILESVDPRYSPTAITVTPCNAKHGTTYFGAAVDIAMEPILGQCGQIDWAVKPIATGHTGGIAGAVTFGATRNELDPSQAATENWQAGIPDIPVNLNAQVICTAVGAGVTVTYAGVDYTGDCAAIGDAMTDPADGSSVHGPALADTYITETYASPKGCVARDKNGGVLTGNTAMPTPIRWANGVVTGDPAIRCVESNLQGWNAAPSEASMIVYQGTDPNAPNYTTDAAEVGLPVPDQYGNAQYENTAQTVNGNYGFGSSKLNLLDSAATNADGSQKYPACSADISAQIASTGAYPDPADVNSLNGGQECIPLDDSGNALELYAPLDGSTAGQSYLYPEQEIKAGDYIVSVDIPKDAYGKPLYQITREEDINVFTGEPFLPQENFPVTDPNAVPDMPAATPGEPITTGLGELASCVGPLHTVHATNPDFIANGGSPYEGMEKPLCTSMIANVRDGSTGGVMFEMFTDVPPATHYWGLILNDLGITSDPSSKNYAEAEGLKHSPTGFRDWTGQVIDTAISDLDGFYEAVVPSSDRANVPSPSGYSPAMYLLTGNDPGAPGHLNPEYDSRYGTISTPFQAWPGLWTVTDTAPVAAGATTFTGSQVNVKCMQPAGEPEIFAVDNPVSQGGSVLTITGQNFGAGDRYSNVLIGAANDANADPSKGTTLTVNSWTDTQITVQIPAASAGFGAGPRSLVVQNAAGQYSTAGMTIHVIGAGYQPKIFTVGAGKQFNTDTWATPYPLQDAIEAAAALGPQANTLVVAYPRTPDAIWPKGDYPESVVIHTGVKLQGIGTGGFQADGTYVPGSIINGSSFSEGDPNGVAWMDLVGGLVGDPNAANPTSPSVIGSDIPVPDAADVTVLTPLGGTTGTATLNMTGAAGQATLTRSGFTNTNNIAVGMVASGTGIATGAVVTAKTNTTVTLSIANAAAVTGTITFTSDAKPAVDGFMLKGGHEATVPTNVNLNLVTLGQRTPYGAAGQAITQGGGVYVHDGATGFAVTNNRIDGNSGAYAGAVRVGTTYTNGNIGANDKGAVPLTNMTQVNQNVSIAHNYIYNNGGKNVAGGIGIFTGSVGYRVAYNDICGNFSAEYGGAISHYGFSRKGSIDHNRMWYNQSYDHGGAVLLGGELTPSPLELTGGTGEVSVTANKIDSNNSNDDGGGLSTLNAGTWPIKVENNEIANNLSTHEGGGIALNNTTGLVLDNNTITGNVTSATASTSNGNPAAAGLATSALDQVFQASLPTGSPTFTRPVAFNNVFWENRAGWFDGATVHGIGLAGDPAPINNWDVGSQDNSGNVPVSNSILQSCVGTTLNQDCSGSLGTNVNSNPQFTKPYTTTVVVDSRRSFFAFRQTLISYETQTPWDKADYSIQQTSPARDIGAVTLVDGGATYTAPTADVNGTPVYGGVDAGSYQWAPPPTVPDAPTGVVVTRGDSQLTVSWTAPVNNGGLPLRSYKATAYNALTGGTAVATCTIANATTCVITGLTNGTTYFVDVQASNLLGYGAASTPRVAGTPATRPGAPTGVITTPKSYSLGVAWTAPASDGGSAITGYTATAYASDQALRCNALLGFRPTYPNCGLLGTQANPPYSQTVGTACTSATLACDITGLTAGTAVYVEVTATNAVGTGPASAPRVAGTPFGVVSSAPQTVSVTAAPAPVVAWTAPATNGGTPVLGYTATAYTAASGGTVAGTCTTTALTCRISPLTAGTTYYVEVYATNAAGNSPAAPSPRASVVPQILSAPNAPTSVTGVRGNGSIAVTWNDAVANGDPVTGYTATVYSALTGGTAIGTCTTTGALTCTVTGLTNGTNYWVAVKATNTIGTSADSAPRVAAAWVTPLVTGVTVSSRAGGLTNLVNRRLDISWTVFATGNVTNSRITVYSDAALTNQVAQYNTSGSVGRLASTATTYRTANDRTFTTGTTYYVVVQASTTPVNLIFNSTPVYGSNSAAGSGVA